MKKEWKYLIAFGLLSILIIGLMTNLKFNDVEVQMPLIHFVITPISAFINFTLILFTIRNLYLLVDMMTERYKIIAVFVVIINPLVGMLVIIFGYFSIKQVYPLYNLFAQLIPICILLGLIAIQTIVEIKTFKKLKELIN